MLVISWDDWHGGQQTGEDTHPDCAWPHSVGMQPGMRGEEEKSQPALERSVLLESL